MQTCLIGKGYRAFEELGCSWKENVERDLAEINVRI
jgi:hypothetical protein